MNHQKRFKFFASFLLSIAVAAIVLIPLAIFAQDTNGAASNAPASGGAVSPAISGIGLILTLIPLAVPVLIAVAKYFLPKVPTWLLPILAPALGALIDFLTSLASGHGANPLVGALLGSAGVGVRELLDQVKQRVKPAGAVAALFLVFGASFFLASGCSWHQNKLEPGGAYSPAEIIVTTNATGGSVTNVTQFNAPDPELYAADLSFDFVYSAVIAVMQTERDNREVFWKISPDIKHTLDKYRPQVVTIATEWAKARKAYLDHPTPGNLSVVQEILSRMKAINAAVASVIPAK